MYRRRVVFAKSLYYLSGKASKVVYNIRSMSHDWCSISHCPPKQFMHALRSRFRNGYSLLIGVIEGSAIDVLTITVSIMLFVFMLYI